MKKMLATMMKQYEQQTLNWMMNLDSIQWIHLLERYLPTSRYLEVIIVIIDRTLCFRKISAKHVNEP